MCYAQIDPQDAASLIDPDQANPGGGWDIIRPLLEQQGYLFVELGKPELPGTHYDRDKQAFYTPQPQNPEPSQTEKDLLAIMEGVAATYERQEKSSLDIMEGLAGLYEATLSGGTQK